MKNVIKYLFISLLIMQAAPALAQQGDFGTDPETCKMNISLYQDAMTRNAYAEAYGPWKKILEICPKWSKSVYVKGGQILNNLISEEKDAARKQRLIDSLYLMYDMRVEHFGEAGIVLGYKAQSMQMYQPDSCEKIFKTAKQAIDEGGSKSTPEALYAYYTALNCQHVKGTATKEQMLSDYVMIMGIVEGRLSDPDLKEADKPYYEDVREKVNNIFFKIAECADIGRIVGDMLKANPDDIQMKTRLLKVLNGKDCQDESVYRSLAEEVHKANPTPESAYSLGMLLVKQNDMNGALRYMKEAVDLCTDCPDRMKYLQKAGQIASATGNHVQARSFANQLLQQDPKNGDAYMLIGNAIIAQASSCEVPQQWGVYWLAYDYYQKAKANDPTAAEKASERMSSCYARFPTAQELFFHQLKEGDAFQVTCGGLNESTTARARK
jgi:tetratricopeptide (TPR) repeat protein